MAEKVFTRKNGALRFANEVHSDDLGKQRT
jgi:hypothetical protein